MSNSKTTEQKREIYPIAQLIFHSSLNHDNPAITPSKKLLGSQTIVKNDLKFLFADTDLSRGFR